MAKNFSGMWVRSVESAEEKKKLAKANETTEEYETALEAERNRRISFLEFWRRRKNK